MISGLVQPLGEVGAIGTIPALGQFIGEQAGALFCPLAFGAEPERHHQWLDRRIAVRRLRGTREFVRPSATRSVASIDIDRPPSTW